MRSPSERTEIKVACFDYEIVSLIGKYVGLDFAMPMPEAILLFLSYDIFIMRYIYQVMYLSYDIFIFIIVYFYLFFHFVKFYHMICLTCEI